MRLIDAEALKQSIREIMPSRTEVNILIDAQRDAIVRCKDCKHLSSPVRGVPFCKHIRTFVNADFFCADGERRTDNG